MLMAAVRDVYMMNVVLLAVIGLLSGNYKRNGSRRRNDTYTRACHDDGYKSTGNTGDKSYIFYTDGQ